MIEFACLECGKQFKVKDEVAGKKGKCPDCGTMLRVPDAEQAPARDDSDYDEALGRTPIERSVTSKGGFWKGAAATLMLPVIPLAWLGPMALHVWTAYLIYEHWGLFWGVCGFLTPPVAEVVTAIAAFFWGMWFYILVIAMIPFVFGIVGVFGSLAEGEVSEDRNRQMATWSAVVCFVALGVLGYFFTVNAHKYYTTVTPQMEQQIQDDAVSVALVLNATSEDDPAIQARYMEAKPKITKAVKELNSAQKRELIRLVNIFFAFRYSVEGDMFTFLTARRQDRNVRPFALSVRTVALLHLLPHRMRIGLHLASASTVKQMVHTTFSKYASIHFTPKVLNMARSAEWHDIGQAYADVLGQPMPDLTKIDRQHARSE